MCVKAGTFRIVNAGRCVVGNGMTGKAGGASLVLVGRGQSRLAMAR